MVGGNVFYRLLTRLQWAIVVLKNRAHFVNRPAMATLGSQDVHLITGSYGRRQAAVTDAT